MKGDAEMSEVHKLIINREQFRDKVMGCWLGKNAGGTLGEPWEEKFGRDEMFHVEWYKDLPEGGIPNDDLELQLIWLQKIMEKGPGIDSADLAEAWMDCIAYNFDEYGLAKENMQKGLLPPVCGWHNNSFKDCMGSPIRSEIWACLAPGNLELAARYARMDAVVDHGGGESVYGEIFNAVLESAAFFLSDKFKLLDLALSYIPKQCLTYQCVSQAIKNYHNGMSYVENRNHLKDAFYNPVAQYSPLNLGFQTIGWLYGNDFGDAICKAVNCGWDTDCTAATLGAILGIIGGAKSLPRKWLEPLGAKIATNMESGGIRHLYAPTDIIELTGVVCEYAEKVAGYWDSPVLFSDTEPMSPLAEFSVPDQQWLVDYAANTMVYHTGGLKVKLIYDMDAAMIEGRASKIRIEIENPHPIHKKIRIAPILPVGFHSLIKEVELVIEAGKSSGADFAFSASADHIRETNTIYFTIAVEAHPAVPALPLVLVGGRKWLFSPLYQDKTIEADCNVPEDIIFSKLPEGFYPVWRTGNDLEIPAPKVESGILYILGHIYSKTERNVVIGVPNNGRMKIFLNGEFLHQTKMVVPLRANLGNGGALGDLSNYKVTKLQKGWNQVLIKLEVKDTTGAHFTLGEISSVCVKNHGMPVLGIDQTKLIWEK